MQPFQADKIIATLDAWLASMFEGNEVEIAKKRDALREALIESGRR